MTIDSGGVPDPSWTKYGRALIHSMAEVTAELPEQFHGLMLETADYWLSLGLAIGTQKRDQAVTLLDVIEGESQQQADLAADAESFCEEALG